jgi:hypothetical protein
MPKIPNGKVSTRIRFENRAEDTVKVIAENLQSTRQYTGDLFQWKLDRSSIEKWISNVNTVSRSNGTMLNSLPKTAAALFAVILWDLEEHWLLTTIIRLYGIGVSFVATVIRSYTNWRPIPIGWQRLYSI